MYLADIRLFHQLNLELHCDTSFCSCMVVVSSELIVSSIQSWNGRSPCSHYGFEFKLFSVVCKQVVLGHVFLCY